MYESTSGGFLLCYQQICVLRKVIEKNEDNAKSDYFCDFSAIF